jgi:hypothetical protein
MKLQDMGPLSIREAVLACVAQGGHLQVITISAIPLHKEGV